MLPGFVLILVLAWTYQRLDLDQPVTVATFMGIQIGVIALIVRAVHRIGEHVLNHKWLWAAAAGSAIGSWLGVSFWIILPVAGLVLRIGGSRANCRWPPLSPCSAWPSHYGPPIRQRITADPADRARSCRHRWARAALFLSGLKAGLLTFGGAYTAIPFVRHDAVGRGWVSDGQFLDSLAMSGIIPAPLIIFATFVGYLAGGFAGALAITAGIFLPAFSFALLFYDRLEQVIEDERLHRFLEGVAAGVVGLIAVTALQLGWNVAQSILSPAIGVAIFAASLALLYLWKSKLNVLAVIAGSAIAGMLAF